MNIIDYLQSDQASRDVADELRRWNAGDQESNRRWCFTKTGFPWIKAFCMGAERDDGTRIQRIQGEPAVVYPTLEAVHAYFRPESIFGDPTSRFIITDLGESVRALRMRTGRVGWCAADYDRAHQDNRVHLRRDALMILAGPDDLPSFICRLMLAAYRVASIDFSERVSP